MTYNVTQDIDNPGLRQEKPVSQVDNLFGSPCESM